MTQVEKGENCLALVDEGPYQMSVMVDLLRECISAGKRIWVVVSSLTFSPFKLFWISSGLGNAPLSVRCRFENVESDGVTTLWSVDLLRNNLDAACAQDLPTLPDILVVENMEMLGEPDSGPALEQVLIGLPLSIPVVAFMAPMANREEILAWFSKVRDRRCGEVGEKLDENSLVPAFLTPDYDLVPLLQKKKIATKVKRVLKENPPIKDTASKSFIQPLVELLKQENLTPTLIVMPSEAACERAVQNYPKNRGDIREIFSSPRISAMFDRYPVLKDRKRVAAALSRQVGAIHSKNHPVWSEMIEVLLALKQMDAVFTTLYDAQAISARVKSVVLTTSQLSLPGQDHGRPLLHGEFRRICQLTASMDDAETAGCLILVHGVHMDMLHIKDQHVKSLSAVRSQFKCDVRATLALAGTNRGELKDLLDMTLWAAQMKPGDISRLDDLIIALGELIPEARCGSARTALALILRHQQIMIELDQTNMKLSQLSNPTELNVARETMEMLKSAIPHFPCHACVHQETCQQLRYKKIREIANAYHDMRHQMKHSASILDVDLAEETGLLTTMGLLDASLKLTSKGKIALQSGCRFPFYVAECLSSRNGSPWGEDLLTAVLAGFVESDPGEMPLLLDDFVDDPLRLVYHWMDNCIEPVKKQLIQNGVVAPGPALAQSAVVRALEKEVPMESVAARSGVSVGVLMRLVQKTNCMAFQFRHLI